MGTVEGVPVADARPRAEGIRQDSELRRAIEDFLGRVGCHASHEAFAVNPGCPCCRPPRLAEVEPGRTEEHAAACRPATHRGG